MPRLADHRLELETLDQDAALVVQGEVHRAEHLLATARRQPPLGCPEQRLEQLLVVLELQEAEHARPAVVEAVVRVVDLGAHTADDASAAARQEVLGLAVLEVGVQVPAQEDPALQSKGGHPGRPAVQTKRQLDKPPQICDPAHGLNVDGHGRDRIGVPTGTLERTPARACALSRGPSFAEGPQPARGDLT